MKRAGLMGMGTLFKEITKKMPHPKEYYVNLGKMAQRTKLSDDARQALSQCIQKNKIQWHPTGLSEHPYQTKIDTHHLRIQMNDFPEESFCTVQRNLTEASHEVPPKFEIVEDIVELNGFKSNWELLDTAEEVDSSTPKV